MTMIQASDLTMYWSKPTTSGRQCTNGGLIIIAVILPKKQGIRAPHQAPSPGILHKENEYPEHWYLRLEGLLWRTKRLWVTETLKGAHTKSDT